MIVRPYILPLLPTFHGMESEKPYTHIRDFEEVCNTFKEDATNLDLMRLKFFPLTLKDKAKIWLNSLRRRTIQNWTEIQAEFLKKIFSTHRTNSLKKHIYTFAAHENEKFYQCWERYLKPIRGTILTSLGNQSLQHMYPLVHSNSMVPHLDHSHHYPYLQLSKL